MFGWWRKNNVDAGVAERPTASEVDAEYAEYLARIRKVTVFGALVGVGGTALFYLFAWWSSQSAAVGSAEGPPIEASPIILAPLPASLTIAGFSLLAAVAIALQLAVRTPSETEARPATALARRRFLCSVASLVVPAAFALAAYAMIPALANAPHDFDVVRMFGPALCGTLVALIAADAGVAFDPEFAPAEMGRVWRARVARRRLIGLRMVGDRPSALRKRTNVWQVFVLVGVPVLVAFASFLSAPDLLVRQRIALVVLALVIASIIYVIAVRIYINAAMRDWFGVTFIITVTIIFGALSWLMFIANTILRAAESRSLAPAMTTIVWAILYVSVPALLAAWSLTPFRDRRPRVLGLIVRRVFVKGLEKRHVGLEPKKGPAYNKLALVAPWVSVFLPFGLILGVIAKQQIRRAQEAPVSSRQRGEWAANLAIGLTVFFVVALIGSAVCIAVIDPSEWDAFIWG